MPDYSSHVDCSEIASEKFSGLEYINFFIEKRRQVMGDRDFSFTKDELIEYLKSNKKALIAKTITVDSIEDSLNALKSFKKRDNRMKIILPAESLLTFEKRIGDVFMIKNCWTESLIDLRRYIDNSIYNSDRPEEFKDKSMFSLLQDHHIGFLGSKSKLNLSAPEYAVFNFLRKNFNELCGYQDLFLAIKKGKNIVPDNPIHANTTESKKIEIVNNAINQLRNKLFKLSGNSAAILSNDDRSSEYSLKY